MTIVRVGVSVRFDRHGTVVPAQLVMPNGEILKIDRIIDMRIAPPADPEVDGQGNRYLILVDGHIHELTDGSDWSLNTDYHE